MSYFLTPDVVEQAVAMVKPTFEWVVRQRLTQKSPGLYIVVMNPLATPWTCYPEAAILYQTSWGETKEKVKEFATAKAVTSWRHRLSTREIQQLYPCLFQVEDVKWAGGVYLDGLAVGASGLEAYFDEMFARMVASACTALCQNALVPILADKDVTFLK